jgi:hypothetical protein
MKASWTWRLASAGLEAGCIDKIFNLPWHTQAMIVAAVETKNELRNVQDWIASQPKNDGAD